MRYIVLSAKDGFDLALTVNEHIKYGWLPTGGVFVNTIYGSAGKIEMFQSMTKQDACHSTEQSANISSETSTEEAVNKQ